MSSEQTFSRIEVAKVVAVTLRARFQVEVQDLTKHCFELWVVFLLKRQLIYFL